MNLTDEEIGRLAVAGELRVFLELPESRMRTLKTIARSLRERYGLNLDTDGGFHF